MVQYNVGVYIVQYLYIKNYTINPYSKYYYFLNILQDLVENYEIRSFSFCKYVFPTWDLDLLRLASRIQLVLQGKTRMKRSQQFRKKSVL